MMKLHQDELYVEILCLFFEDFFALVIWRSAVTFLCEAPERFSGLRSFTLLSVVILVRK